MTVSKISQNKAKIALTDTEVISLFGDYERLFSMSNRVKLTLNILLQDTIASHKLFTDDCKISAKLRIITDCGCEITLSKIPIIPKSEKHQCVFEFSNAEALTGGIKALYSNKVFTTLPSSLYKSHCGYRLIIDCKAPKESLFFLNEFCFKISDSPEELEYTKEYCRLITKGSAIQKYGKAFFN